MILRRSRKVELIEACAPNLNSEEGTCYNEFMILRRSRKVELIEACAPNLNSEEGTCYNEFLTKLLNTYLFRRVQQFNVNEAGHDIFVVSVFNT